MMIQCDKNEICSAINWIQSEGWERTTLLPAGLNANSARSKVAELLHGGIHEGAVVVERYVSSSRPEKHAQPSRISDHNSYTRTL